MREKKKGIFKSFVDFINRVNAKDVNKLQLEGLVKAGVFDEFDKDRNKILNSIPKIIQKIKNINDDKDNHQSNLFDDQENEKNLIFTFNHWTQKELLSEEFKSIGFYLTNHPLMNLKKF
jgi:DNA polymerase-3 subunit alpha